MNLKKVKDKISKHTQIIKSHRAELRKLIDDLDDYLMSLDEDVEDAEARIMPRNEKI